MLVCSLAFAHFALSSVKCLPLRSAWQNCTAVSTWRHLSLVCLSDGESEVKVILRFLAIDAGTVLFLWKQFQRSGGRW